MALVTAAEVAQELRCSKSKVYALAKAGAIPCSHVGDLVRFNLEKVLAALETNAGNNTARPTVVKNGAKKAV